MIDQSPPNYKPWLAAALDLGSNSFHVTIVDTRKQPFRVLFRYGEKVQLGAGLDADNQLSSAAIERGLTCIHGMAERMAEVAPQNRHVVATNTLRVANNRQTFIAPAEQILQASIRVVTGEEEAELIYQGVLDEISSLNIAQHSKLVVDIGGGSTEIVLGNSKPQILTSFPMGCVAFSQQFFPDRLITPQAIDHAVAEAKRILSPRLADYTCHDWQICIGSSGTIKALAALSEETESAFPVLTAASMVRVREQILQFATLDDVRLPYLRPDRGEVLPAGYAIMQGVMEAFSLDRVYFSTGALREGVIAGIVNPVRKA